MSNKVFQIGMCLIAIPILGMELVGCKKFVQIDPPTTQITAPVVYSNNSSASAVMTGMYSNMISGSGLSSGLNSISELEALAADELDNYSPSNITFSQFYLNALSSSTGTSSNTYYWGEIYNQIHIANVVLEGVGNSSAVSSAMKRQLEGEAKFMRAFFHFYAVNLYGDVPLVTTSNYLTNNALPRTPVATVYQQVIQDLKDAQANLTDGYLDAYGATTTARTRPNKGAAASLLARTYLYTKKWDSAEDQATLVINNSSTYELDANLNDVFLGNSTEAIWQLMPNNPGYNTFDGYYFIPTGPLGSSSTSVALSSSLLTSFEPGDMRQVNWINVYSDAGTPFSYPFKYKIGISDGSKPVTEYTMMIRLAELYLIRAEARAEQGNIAGAQADLNMIRTRAGLSNTNAADRSTLLAAILHERQTELFTEWGHRWLDLKRTGNINAVMGAVSAHKGSTWKPEWALIPLPLSEVQINNKLSQNPGY